ncbi:NACHT domain-containing protein [Saccharothrix carnea]|uniref:NACHT domain-containing protein n=1 Tax=Saccharothrix carnea TaxID=1280637 RepID=A0A2P8IFD3_SACCR|nr:NACHT domain-containing protein [Saccharothrix carnea]PSL57189.1 NACHT domain-containing protein [Saccharothrix carnea]
MQEGSPSADANRIGGDVHGAAVLAGTIHGGVHITVAGAEPTPDAPAQDEPALTGLPAPVRFLLRAQVDTAREMPYRLPGPRRSSLVTVHVRQDLGSGSDDLGSEPPRPVPIVDGRGQVVEPPSLPITRLAVRAPTRTVSEALDRDDHVVITGGPGQGKSTLSLRLAADVAEQWLSGDGEAAPMAERVVPLRLTARELAGRLSRPFPEAVVESAGAEYGALLASPLDPRALEGRIAGCRWLLLVDGLDEVADTTERDRLVTVLAAWAAEPTSPYRVVVTTRPIEGAALAPLQRIGAARYELQPFDERALRQFARNWFGDRDRAYRFVRQIRAAHLDELARVPLLATIAAIIFEQPGNRPLPDNQYELYEAYLKYLRTAHTAEPGPFDAVRDALLEHLGRVRLEADTSLVDAALDWAAQHVPDLTGAWQDDLITYLAAVGPLSRRGEDLRFLHHSFAEHLAATAKARLLPEHFDPAHADFAGLLHAARTEDRGRHARAVLLHHTRLHPSEAERLLEHLHSGGSDQHLLAARLLARHLPAGSAAVDAFLTTVRAWAMTTQHPALKILSQTSRAAHHPGTAAWLVDLMGSDDVPWPSRVEAAAALATRLRGPESTEAAHLLRRVVDDSAIPVEHRLAAAEALAECGPDGHRASAQGLRAILASYTATAEQLRNAAVVLAGFDGEAREHAIAALTAVLDNRDAPDHARVHAATGLVEIDVEHHERGAEVFREVLGTRTHFSAGLRDAAVGLASLGPHHSDEAVATLTRLVADQRLPLGERVSAAEALAELGPQHRMTATNHLVALSTAFGIAAYLRTRIAQALADIGAQDQAWGLLRAVLGDWATDANGRTWAAQALAELGPEHRDEAAIALRGATTHPTASTYDTLTAFTKLAALGEPYRTPAVASLRAMLCDRSADASFRAQAGSQLVGLGPEFHDEVTHHLSEIAIRQADPEAQRLAWRALRRLGTRFRERSSAAMLSSVAPEQAELWASHYDYPVFDRLDVTDPDVFAAAMTAVLRNPAWGGRARRSAASTLIALGRRFHQRVVDAVVDQIEARTVPNAGLPTVVADVDRLGAGMREEVAAALRDVASDPDTSAATLCRVAMAMEKLDRWSDPVVVARLEGITAHDLSPLSDRADAAVALARAIPGEIDTAVATVMRETDDTAVPAWKSRLRVLAELGADLAAPLRACLADGDAGHHRRLAAAEVLVELRPGRYPEALSEIRGQAADDCLDYTWRTDAVMLLARHDPTAVDAAVAFHARVLDDESQSVRDRSEAACRLMTLDPGQAGTAFAALRRFATSPEFTTEEQSLALAWLAYRAAARGREVAPLALALFRDPATGPEDRRRLATVLQGRDRFLAEQDLLADHAASPAQRVGDITEWVEPTLAVEAAARLRDVMTAAETMPADRIRAAAALAGVSPRWRSDAVAVIEESADNPDLTYNVCEALLNLKGRKAHGLLSEDAALVLDATGPWRERAQAARRICTLIGDTPAQMIPVLREMAEDPRTSGVNRMRVLYILRKVGGLQRLRRLRDDERESLAIRWWASLWLNSQAADDRAAGLRVLHRIATDATCRPALRWRAARDLLALGERGREVGTSCLRAIATDEALPFLPRVDAARELGAARPDLRTEVMSLLRRLRSADNLLVRVRVLDAIGRFDSAEGAIALRDTARDRTLRPGARLRAAAAAAELRRDHREAAAIVAREIAHNPAVPRHIRVKAARALARWSELCRSEARALLVELGVGVPAG